MENVTSPKALAALMKKYNIAPLKRFGQNFLIDGNIAEKIAAAAAPGIGRVLEIGPGFGALTQKLLARAEELAAYEIDAGLYAALKNILSTEVNFTLFHKDFLKADIEADLNKVFGRNNIFVAANLPYYITSPCIMKLLESKLNIEMITVMVQKEVAERICAGEGSRNFGAFSAAVGFFAETKLLMRVSASCFYPKPDVESAVVQLKRKIRSGVSADAYLKTVKILFAMRRKTVLSNLRKGLGIDKALAESVLKAAQIDSNLRAENLGVDDLIRISNVLSDRVEPVSDGLI
ncbi:MAG: 16S rRNA (adenine(1518)-N(6)/adenine(1519)-N(6))-dimethyltransferase RsmA [Christensenellales bacterium]